MTQTQHRRKRYLFAHITVKYKLFLLSQLESYATYLNSSMFNSPMIHFCTTEIMTF